jgi:hypothetical protein
MKQCIICGKEFDSPYPRQKTCCKKCSDENIKNLKNALAKKYYKVKSEGKRKWYRMNHPLNDKVCLFCGKMFTPRHGSQRICPECKAANRCRMDSNPSSPKIVKCVMCGKEFESIRGTAKYCSVYCHHKRKSQRAREILDALTPEQRKIRCAKKKKNTYGKENRRRMEESMIGLSKDTISDLFDDIFTV